ncbi:MAG: leucyl/phenylalanyl-tRNA--protein transferase [Lentisphaerae bacterium]|nr:leucyl/phenylalanyl-tRNA--protein transferase [Lentisphaerota bacterium]
MIRALTEELTFPPLSLAGSEGLLAFGGDLSVERLVLAYRSGIFPWYNDDQPILWFSPDPRLVLFPRDLRVTNSLRRVMMSGRFRVTWDTAFPLVVRNCREIDRPGQPGTWITGDMEAAYVALHEAGHAHSVEVWQDEDLVGGLYGVTVDRCFCGESMFARVSNVSKIAFVLLVKKLAEDGFNMIDCQLPTDHLKRFGAIEISRARFLSILSGEEEPGGQGQGLGIRG